ncbi:hypothetical protein JW887_06635 [Candidatus Dojkabacteria bacterium]|nr:hypothetical protein [Candidatus Dojkabacteria bacterium]
MSKLPVINQVFHTKETSDNNIFTYWFNPPDSNVVRQKGFAGLFISLNGPKSFDMKRAADFMWDSFTEGYFYSVGVINDILKRSVKSVQSRLIDLIKNEEFSSDEGIDLNLCALVVHEGSIYCSLIGEPEVILLREGHLVDVSEIVPAYNGEGYRSDVSVGSFRVEKNDLLFVSVGSSFELLKAEFEERSIPFANNWKDWCETLNKNIVKLGLRNDIWLVGYENDVNENSSGRDMLALDSDLEKTSVTGKSPSINDSSSKDSDDGVMEEIRDGQDLNSGTDSNAKPKSKGLGNTTHELMDIKSSEVNHDSDLEQDSDVSNIDDRELVDGEEQTGVQSYFKKISGFTSGLLAKVSESTKNSEFLNKLKFWDKKDKSERQIKSGSDVVDQDEEWESKRHKLEKDNKPDKSAPLKSPFARRFALFKRNFAAKFSQIKFGTSKDKKLYVNPSRTKTPISPKFWIGVGLIIIAVIIGVVATIRYRNNVVSAQIDIEISDINQLLVDAQNVWNTDKNKAVCEEKMKDVEDKIDKLESQKLTDEQKDKLQGYKEELDVLYDSIYRVSPVSEDLGNFEIYFDSYLKINEDAELTDIAIKGTSIFVVDKANAAVFKINLEDGSFAKVANSDDIFKEPVLIETSDSNLFVYDNEVGMVSLNLTVSEAEWSFKIMPELSARTLGEVQEIATFGDNIYILRRTDARVLRAVPAGSGYGYPQEYIPNGAFDKARDILIDGNIYVIGNWSEKIYKFYSGNQDPFSLSELDKPLGFITCGFTNLYDQKPLYIYDEENERIVVIEKGTGDQHPGVGVMTKQLVYRGERDDIFKEVKDFVVDSDEVYMYVLDKNRVLRISLN